MSFGLRNEDIDYIVKTLKKFPEIKRAMIFGSRAKGTNKNGSDVDMAVFGEKINFGVLSRLHSILENDSPMPYFFDIVDYTHLEHDELRQHIDRVGKIIYER